MTFATDMITAEYRVRDMACALDFCGALFGRGPDFRASDTFVEWELVPGSWFQIRETPETGTAGPLRWRVDDVEAERQRLIETHGLAIDPVTRVEGVVAYCTFTDPFGNPLGLLQDLAS